MTFAPSDTFGNTYVPQYVDYTISPEEVPSLLTRRDTQLALALNFKTNGIFETTETQNGDQYFGVAPEQRKKRFAFRKVFSIDPTALTFDHGITGATQFTHIYGVINTASDSRPLPYVDVVNVTNQTALRVTATQVIITNGATATAITGGIVVLEYLKQ